MNFRIAILILFFPFLCWSQIQVSGKVIVKSDGSLLPGVNIIEKGTKNTAITDFDGEFSIIVKDKNVTLILSFIGFLTKEITLKKEKNIIIELKEDCNIDWFDSQHIGFYVNSGVINTPIGGQFNFTFPAIFGQPTLKSSISYQTNLKGNRFFNAHLNLHHLFVSCNFDADVNTSYRNLSYESNLNLNAFSFETSLNWRPISFIIGYSKIEYTNIKELENINSSGLTLGIGSWIGQPFLMSVSGKVSIYNDLIEYHAEVNRRFKSIYGFVKYYNVNSFYELSIGVGFEITYRLKRHK